MWKGPNCQLFNYLIFFLIDAPQKSTFLLIVSSQVEGQLDHINSDDDSDGEITFYFLWDVERLESGVPRFSRELKLILSTDHSSATDCDEHGNMLLHVNLTDQHMTRTADDHAKGDSYVGWKPWLSLQSLCREW